MLVRIQTVRRLIGACAVAAHLVRGSVSLTICSTRALLCCTSLLCSSSSAFCSCRNVPHQAMHQAQGTCRRLPRSMLVMWGATDIPALGWGLVWKPRYFKVMI